jgi:hypothetical protein
LAGAGVDGMTMLLLLPLPACLPACLLAVHFVQLPQCLFDDKNMDQNELYSSFFLFVFCFCCCCCCCCDHDGCVDEWVATTEWKERKRVWLQRAQLSRTFQKVTSKTELNAGILK